MERIIRALKLMGIPDELVVAHLRGLDEDKLDELAGTLEQISGLSLSPYSKLTMVAGGIANALVGTKVVIQECPTCHGTRLFTGSGRPKNEAVVCRKCSGHGWSLLFYVPYNGLKQVEGVELVYPWYRIDQHPPGPDQAVTYEEFLAGKLPGVEGKVPLSS